jgi:hypothetical protein
MLSLLSTLWLQGEVEVVVLVDLKLVAVAGLVDIKLRQIPLLWQLL